MKKECKILDLKTFNNKGYSLTPIEFKDVVPFEVMRMYHLELPPGVSTGEHCHMIEEELFFQIKGSSTIVIDRGNGKEEIRLKGPGSAIYVPAYVWHGFKDGDDDCIIMALSSTNYNPTRGDYMENYEEYLKIRDQKLV